jgi:hypothetical protein
MTTAARRFFRADISLYGPLTDAQLERLLGVLAGAAELAGAHVSGGWVETTESGEDLEPGEGETNGPL